MSPTSDAEARPVPELGKVRRPKLPTVAERVLDNGLRVVAVRRPSVPVVHVRLRVPTAVRKDADLAKARLLERSMMLGTSTRSRGDLAEALQAMGGSLHVSGDADRLSLSGETLTGSLPTFLELLAEVVTDAAYPRDEVEGERDRLAEQTQRALNQPGTVADEAWLRSAFGTHPYGREHPTPDEIRGVAPASVRAAHRRRMVPDGSLLVLVGDLSPARVLDRVAAAFEPWAADGSATRVPKLSAWQPGTVELVDRRGAVQSNLRVGGPALPRTDPSYAALEVANALFGGYFSSRLVRNIREDKGYTYSPRSSLQHGERASFMLLQAEVATEVTAPAMLEVAYELGRIAALPPTEDEVRDTAQYLIGALALSTATSAGLAGTLTVLLSQGLDVTWLREHPQRLLAVTPDDVHAVARDVFAPSRMRTTIVGDAGIVAGPLTVLGEVTRL
jgi:predicted Zn-dependent peptidase